MSAAGAANNTVHAAPYASALATQSAADIQDAIAGDAGNAVEEQIFRKLEDAKRRKAQGERVTPVYFKDVAAQAKPLFPGMPLEKLVRMFRLFASARYEDHDLYLRILGEIPMQVRGISPSMLTTVVKVLRRLRLPEETYLELFSMEAMNMIRAKRRPQARRPRPPAPSRKIDASTNTAAGSGAVLTPRPPSTPPPEATCPFSAAELVQIGNALTLLGSKHPPRFMEVYQEQLAVSIPRMTQQECELVSPTLAMSQLMHDPLRRAFLERCAKVDAGQPLPEAPSHSAPNIAEYQRDFANRRTREKHFRNIYIIEASARKETFSFFTSLPPEVRAYLDTLHERATSLQHEGSSLMASQIATVLDQLGVSCDLSRMAGPLGLHVVAKNTNPRNAVEEVVYECSDATAFYAVSTDGKSAPVHTSYTKLRHKLLQRIGVQLTHIGVWEWQQMSEAQRINYMVKLQSLQ